jgi:hypothetical protein
MQDGVDATAQLKFNLTVRKFKEGLESGPNCWWLMKVCLKQCESQHRTQLTDLGYATPQL